MKKLIIFFIDYKNFQKEFNEINKQLYQDIVYKIKRNKLLEQYFSSARKSATIVILDSSLK